jgi:hypothetical protein
MHPDELLTFINCLRQFVLIWKKYALSHFYLGFELVAGLLVYELFSDSAPGPVSYMATTWPIWLLVFATCFVPVRSAPVMLGPSLNKLSPPGTSWS